MKYFRFENIFSSPDFWATRNICIQYSWNSQYPMEFQIDAQFGVREREGMEMGRYLYGITDVSGSMDSPLALLGRLQWHAEVWCWPGPTPWLYSSKTGCHPFCTALCTPLHLANLPRMPGGGGGRREKGLAKAPAGPSARCCGEDSRGHLPSCLCAQHFGFKCGLNLIRPPPPKWLARI